jgi:transcriptional regulator with XRE-family HTH domain
MVVLRQEIGDVLRDTRQRQGRTLREVSSSARVSLGYLSEVERGQKEASSELLASICTALDMPLSTILREVSDRIAVAEGLIGVGARYDRLTGTNTVATLAGTSTIVPDTIPDDLLAYV